jgi:DNA processing protein
VSGLALGIDGVAHRAALEAGLPTIAVPGSGLSEEVLYPRAHLSLAREIVSKGGALLSEMKPEEPAAPYTFPKRNRIMAGIADATLIVEAGVKSGTLITARLVSDYNRELLVVPHSIFAEGGAGGHIFMKLGAAPVRESEDILDALGIPHEKVSENLALTPDEEAVMVFLREPMPRDELVRSLEGDTASTNVLLAGMELKGLITETGGMIRRMI